MSVVPTMGDPDRKGSLPDPGGDRASWVRDAPDDPDDPSR